MPRLWMLVGLAVVAVACEGGGGGGGGGEARNTLVFRDESGSAIEMPERTYVWCAPWGEGESTTRALHVLVAAVGNNEVEPPLWRFDATVEGVELGEPIRFPHEVVEGPDVRGAVFFAAWGSNQENSSMEEESTGTMTIDELACGDEGHVSFSIEATLGSEYIDGNPVEVEGSFSSPTGEASPEDG